MEQSRHHAVVLGGSMAGLLAARVLSEFYDRVTVIERDVLPSAAAPRRGVPQGRHVHTLLAGGGEVLDDLFPGLLAELESRGAPVIDDLDQVHFRVLGHLFHQGPMRQRPLYQPTRALLEATVRARVRALPGVLVRDGLEVLGPLVDRDRSRVTGVRFGAAGCAHVVPDTLDADLVVDAMGRAGRTPAWLRDLGYAAPAEELVPVDVRYTTQRLRLRPGTLDTPLTAVTPMPGRLRGVVLFANEDDTWTFTVFGYGAQQPPQDRDDMLAYCADLVPARTHAALREAEPLDDLVAHRFPASQRRRYERLGRFPEGLLTFGDAICSFNPVYGQGMTVAAHQALALRRALGAGDDRLATRFFRAAARPVDVAWQLAVGSDLALPEVEGPRTTRVRIVNAWVERVLAAAEHDPVVAMGFVRVMSLLDPPTALFRPSLVRRVLRPTQEHSDPRADSHTHEERHAHDQRARR